MKVFEKILDELKYCNDNEKVNKLKMIYIVLQDMRNHEQNRGFIKLNDIFNDAIEDIYFNTHEEKSIVLEVLNKDYYYKLFLKEYLRCLSYDDSYYNPEITFYKFYSEYVHDYGGGEYNLNLELEKLHKLLEKPKINMDDIHKEALIEDLQRELNRLIES